MNLLFRGVAACMLMLLSGPVAGEDLNAATEAWRQQRYATLKKPDGYLTLIGSGLLQPGTHRVGSGPDNDIVLPQGPSHLGVLTLDPEGRARFQSAPDGEGRVDGARFDQIALKTQTDTDGPTRIQIGQMQFYLVRMADLIGWRLRDPQAALRLNFDGIPHYPIDPAWRIRARWEPFDRPRPLERLTVIGTPEPGTAPGRAVFELDGTPYTLIPTEAENGRLFFVFADRTSGKISYGGGRFLYAEAPEDGHVVLDFNRAYNPPCALNPHVVCPLAPPENRLRLAVEAGEKKPEPH